MLLDPGVYPSLAKDRIPRSALESLCCRILVSAHLARVGLLIASLSTLGCFVRAPDYHVLKSHPLGGLGAQRAIPD
ncbi:Condensin-2 Complex Subunit D3 [Manis pentadactyla]|nr:Condensin-2 Complex Subunit D3 [Manis pentadactyla]